MGFYYLFFLIPKTLFLVILLEKLSKMTKDYFFLKNKVLIVSNIKHG